jgi:hypothetical protein
VKAQWKGESSACQMDQRSVVLLFRGLDSL